VFFLFVATLVGIFRFKDLPEKYGPFAQHKASIEKRTIKDNDEIAILNIAGTESHHVLFLNEWHLNLQYPPKSKLQQPSQSLAKGKVIIEGFVILAFP